MSFIKKAVEVIQHGMDAGGDAIHEFNVNRRSAELFLKLGIAVYAEQVLDGPHEPVERMFQALAGHVAENGAVDLEDLKAAHEVLGEEFVALHDPDSEEAQPAAAAPAPASTSAPAPAPAPAAAAAE